MYRLWQINKYDPERKKKQTIVNVRIDTDFWALPLAIQYDDGMPRAPYSESFMLYFLCFGVKFTFIPSV